MWRHCQSIGSSAGWPAKKRTLKKKAGLSRGDRGGSSAPHIIRQTVVSKPRPAKRKAGVRRSTPPGAYQRATLAYGQVRASEPRESWPANLSAASGRKLGLKAADRSSRPWKAVANECNKVRATRAIKGRMRRFTRKTGGPAEKVGGLERSLKGKGVPRLGARTTGDVW